MGSHFGILTTEEYNSKSTFEERKKIILKIGTKSLNM